MEFTERERINDPFTNLFNIIYRSNISEERLEKIINMKIIELLLSCNPDNINLEKLKEAIFPTPPSFPTLFVKAEKRSIEEMLVAGKQSFSNPNINSTNFKSGDCGFEGHVYIDPIKNGSTTNFVINYLTIRGFRPLCAFELLSYAIAHKNVQRNYTLVALGDFWEDENGKKWVVVIGADDDYRGAYLACLDEPKWNSNFFCAYVAK